MRRNWSILALSMFICACSFEQASDTNEILIADVRKAIQTESFFSMKDDVKSIEYIPLETTDSCLISNIISLIADDDYIFLLNGKTSEIFQFNRRGKFIRQIGRVGEGPGEYAPYSIHTLSLNHSSKEIILNRRYQPALVYAYDGTYLRTDTTFKESIGHRYPLDNGMWVLTGMNFVPKQASPWLLALQDKEGQLYETQSVFPASVPEDFVCMREVHANPFEQSVVAFTPSCDTLFRATTSGIRPICVYNRENGTEYYTLIADARDMQTNKAEKESTLQLFSFFETSRFFYFRAIMKGNPDKLYFQRLDKQSGEFLSQSIPQDFIEVSKGFSDGQVIGIPNDLDNGIPFCPSYVANDKTSMQVINAETIAKLKDKGYLKNAPTALNIDELDNPVVIIYHFR